MKKKKSSSQRNFFRTMIVLGVVVIGGAGYGFIDAAPNLSQTEFHRDKTPRQCLNCHTRNVENTPIMPHRPMEFCGFCHPPQKAPEP